MKYDPKEISEFLGLQQVPQATEKGEVVFEPSTSSLKLCITLKPSTSEVILKIVLPGSGTAFVGMFRCESIAVNSIAPGKVIPSLEFALAGHEAEECAFRVDGPPYYRVWFTDWNC